MFKDTTVEDLCTILKGTVIRYKGLPVLVKDVLDHETIMIQNYVDKLLHKADIGSEDVDYEPFSLGFVNAPLGVYYISREPTRQFRQGLCTENMAIRRVNGIDLMDNEGFINNFRRLGDGVTLTALVKGIYPSLKDAKEALDKGVAKVRAFSRGFAVDAAGRLIYKTNVVGLLDWETDRPVFYRNKQHLSWLWERRNESV